MKNPQIRAWKTDLDFIVAVGPSCYEMDNKADAPNGVCIYLGELDRLSTDAFGRELRGTDEVPLAALRQTVELVARVAYCNGLAGLA